MTDLVQWLSRIFVRGKINVYVLVVCKERELILCLNKKFNPKPFSIFQNEEKDYLYKELMDAASLIPNRSCPNSVSSTLYRYFVTCLLAMMKDSIRYVCDPITSKLAAHAFRGTLVLKTYMYVKRIIW